MESRWDTTRQAEHVGHEAHRGDLKSELFPHSPHLCRTVHGTQEILGNSVSDKNKWESAALTRVMTSSGTIFERTSSSMSFFNTACSCFAGCTGVSKEKGTGGDRTHELTMLLLVKAERCPDLVSDEEQWVLPRDAVLLAVLVEDVAHGHIR